MQVASPLDHAGGELTLADRLLLKGVATASLCAWSWCLIDKAPGQAGDEATTLWPGDLGSDYRTATSAAGVPLS